MPTYKLHFHEDINFWTTNKKVSSLQGQIKKKSRLATKKVRNNEQRNVTNRVLTSQPFMLHPLYVTPPIITRISEIKS